MEVKSCNKCNFIKSVKEFNKGSYVRKDGTVTYSFICKLCESLDKKEYYKNNRDHVIAKTAKWKENNYEKDLENSRKYYHDNKEKCLAQRKKNRDKENPVSLSIKRKKWYRNNPEPKLKLGKKWRENNREYMNQKQREWAGRNKDSRAALQAKRRASKIKRTPKWLTEKHKLAMKAFYTEAKRLTIETGIKHVVDHIVPLQGKTMSGLHVPWNLQILTESENSRKSNSLSLL